MSVIPRLILAVLVLLMLAAPSGASVELGRLQWRVNALTARVTAVELSLGEIEPASYAVLVAEVAALAAQLATLDPRLDEAEAALASIEPRVTTLEVAVAALQAAHTALEARVAALEIPTPTDPPVPPLTLTPIDIGTGVAGTFAEVTPPIDFDVSAEGLDIFGTADSFHFAYKSVTGDFDYIVRIFDFTGPDVGGKAGLMARESLDANSKNVFMGATINATGHRFQVRAATGGTTTKVEGGTVSFPNVWVRLTRAGNVFTGYTSADGTSWTQFGQTTQALSSTLKFGLATNSHAADETASAEYRAFAVKEAAAPGGYADSGPITTTSVGQTITGKRITSPSGPCITVAHANVVIHDNIIGPCFGHGVVIDNKHGGRISNNVIATGRTKTGTDQSHGVYLLNGSSDWLIQGNQATQNESFIEGKTVKKIKVKGNYSYKPLGPFPRGQHVQLYPCNQRGVIGDRCEVTDNYFLTDEGPHHQGVGQEDAVNHGSATYHAYVARNFIKGGGASSGCGIIAEGESHFAIFEDNVIIRTAQCGISIVNGGNGIIRRNKVLDTNVTGGSGNTGIVAWYDHRGSTTICAGTAVTENTVSNLLPTGVYSDIWVKSGCGTQSSNTKGNAARALLVPEATFLPPPSIPPLPWTP